MSRILKRPMFKRGGQSNDGIMSNVVDREQYALGSIDEEKLRFDAGIISSVLDRFAPIEKTRLPLGEVGFALASGADPIDALGLGYKKFVKADDAREAALAKRRGAAVSTALSSQLKEPKISKTKSVYDTVKKANVLASDKQIQAEPDRYLPAIKKESLTFKSGIDTRTGKRGYFTNDQILESKGAIQPIDNRMAFTFDTDTNTLTQLPISERDRLLDNKAKAQEIVGSVNTVEKIKNKMLADLKNTPTGPVGSLYGILEATSDQLSQASLALGFNKDSLDFDINTSEKLDNYLEGKGVTKGAANFAKMKGSVINLAYQLAKIKEPGNPKLSEGDIIRQLDRLQFGASRDVFAAALNNVFDDEVIAAKGQITGYGLDPDKYFGIKKDKTNISGKKEIVPGGDQNYDPLGILNK